MQIDPAGKRFCEVAMRQGHLTREQAISVLKRQKELRDKGDKRIAGLVAIQLGLISKDQAKAVIAEIKGYTAADKPVCGSCGIPLDPGSVICVACGYNSETGQKLSTEMSVEAPAEPAKPPPKWKRPGYLAGIAIRLTVVILAGAALFVLRPWEWVLPGDDPAGEGGTGPIAEFDIDDDIEDIWEDILPSSPAWPIWQSIRDSEVTWSFDLREPAVDGGSGQVSLTVSADGVLRTSRVTTSIAVEVVEGEAAGMRRARRRCIEAAVICAPLDFLIESKRNKPEVRGLAVSLLSSESTEIRSRALRLLSRFPDFSAEIGPAVSPFLESPIEDEVDRALSTLLTIDPEWVEVGPAIRSLIPMATPSQLARIHEAVAHQSGVWLEDNLLSALQVSSAEDEVLVRIRPLIDLVAKKSDTGLQWACGLATRDNEHGRRLLAEEKSRDRVLRLVQSHPDARVRLAFVGLVGAGEAGDKRTRPFLEACLDDRDSTVSRAAARLLGASGGDTSAADLRIVGDESIELSERLQAFERLLLVPEGDERIDRLVAGFLKGGDEDLVLMSLKYLRRKDSVDPELRDLLIDLVHQPRYEAEAVDLLTPGMFGAADGNAVNVFIRVGGATEAMERRDRCRRIVLATYPGCVPALRDALVGDDPRDVAFAAEVLKGVQIETDELVSELTACLSDPDYADFSGILARALLARGSAGVEAARGFLAKGLGPLSASNDPTATARASLIEVVSGAESEESASLIARSAGDRNIDVIRAVCRAATGLGDRGHDIWKKVLASDNHRVLDAALRILSESERIAPLEKSVESLLLSSRVRETGPLTELYEAWELDLVKPMWKVLGSKDPKVLARLVDLLDAADARPAKGVQILDKLAKSKLGRVGRDAIGVLGKYAENHKSAVRALERLAESADPSVKSAASQQLNRIKKGR